ncbi:MAG TPA: hypothetical protein VJ801_09695, partial [Polyangia bacterium]|nr:hypothetical protein [Polyangia bacterium]
MARATLHDRATWWLRHLLHGVLLAVALLFTSVRPATAQTPVPGGTLGDTTWTAAGSPYIVSGGLTVAAGATLTVEPGVTVQFDGYWLTVDGTLIAVGTAAAPIVIKGLSDTPGYWDGITIEGDSGNINTGSRLAYVTLSDGKPNLTLFYAHVTVANSVISNSSSDGIYGEQAGVADVSATSFTGNQGYGLSFDDGSVDPALASITMSGNGTNAIRLGGGTIAASRTWKNVGVPYQIEGGFTVAAGATLTVEPGVTVQFDGHWLTVDGTLMAVGTAAAPIVFKGLSDTPGYWDGISIQGDPGNINTGSRLEYVTVSDGRPNLDLYFARVTVANSVISNSGSDGIHGQLGGVADVSATRFTGNQGYGLSFDDGSVDPALASIAMIGSGTNAIRFAGGTIGASRTWKNLGLPYRITGGLVVAAGATLTVEAGVTVQFDGSWLTVDGTLMAVGTAAAPIVFKGLSDTPGYWDGITIEGDSGNINTGSRLEYVTVSDGKPNLDLYFARVTVANSVISNSSSDGIHGQLGGIADVSATRFTGNQGYGLSFDDGSVDPALASIVMSGSGTNAIRLGGGTIG